MPFFLFNRKDVFDFSVDKPLAIGVNITNFNYVISLNVLAGVLVVFKI